MAPRHNNPGPGDGGGLGLRGALSRFWARTYAPDYAGLAGMLAAYLLIQFLVEPFHRMFYVTDMRIAFPHAAVERVPVWLNFVYALFAPLAALLLYAAATRASSHKLHNALLGLAVSTVLACLLTDVVKNAVGRPRPDLLARCKPAPGTPTDALVSLDVCTETDHHLLHDGWRSFPSGHSSFSFSGLGYLAFFLAGQLRVFRGRRDISRALVCLAPLLGALMVAISRCEDYRHDVYDVCTGSLLGYGVAWFVYRRYWPSLSSRACHEPYPPPGSCPEDDEDDDDSNRASWTRVRDEEQGPMLGRAG